MEKLNILWTTTNRETISYMLKMYAINARLNGWWDEINIIIWGGSAKLIGENEEVQSEVKEMLEHGIHIKACLVCSDKCGVTESLQKLGVETIYMGESLTSYLKNGEKILSL